MLVYLREGLHAALMTCQISSGWYTLQKFPKLIFRVRPVHETCLRGTALAWSIDSILASSLKDCSSARALQSARASARSHLGKRALNMRLSKTLSTLVELSERSISITFEAFHLCLWASRSKISCQANVLQLCPRQLLRSGFWFAAMSQ